MNKKYNNYKGLEWFEINTKELISYNDVRKNNVAVNVEKLETNTFSNSFEDILYGIKEFQKKLEEYKSNIPIVDEEDIFNCNGEWVLQDWRFCREGNSNSLKECLNILEEYELETIGDTLGYKIYPCLEKEKLVEIILSGYERRVINKINCFDEKALKELSIYYNNKSRLFDNIPEQDQPYMDYFIDLGIIFPITDHKGNEVCFMPFETAKIIKKLNLNFED